MERPSYKPLAQAAISSAGCYVLDAHNPTPVRADSPAVEVMTDLSKIPVATVSLDDTLSDANQSMLLRGVRLLLVVSHDDRVRGVITTADLLGEKPVQVAQHRGIKRNELRVADVMTPVESMEVLDLGDVLRAEVGHIVATLKAVSRVQLWLSRVRTIRCCAAFSQPLRLRGNSVCTWSAMKLREPLLK